MPRAKRARPPLLLEWIAAAVGLLLALGVMGAIARDAFNGSAEMAPNIVVAATNVRATGTGFLLEFEAHNLSPVTAAQVTIEGKLPGGETGQAVIDYIPGRSARQGGLFFTSDPRAAQLRPLGYQNP